MIERELFPEELTSRLIEAVGVSTLSKFRTHATTTWGLFCHQYQFHRKFSSCSEATAAIRRPILPIEQVGFAVFRELSHLQSVPQELGS